MRRNVREASSVGITTTQPRNGDGSAQFTGGNGTSKGDFEIFFSAPQLLSNLTSFGYDWYRAGTSTNPNVQVPALRLYIDADGNAATTTDRGYLIYEPVYNNAGGWSAPTDSWVAENVTDSSNLWLRQFTPGASLEVYNITLGKWKAGGVSTTGNPAIQIAPGPDTTIYGLSFGTGSGWNGTYSMFVDNVRLGFGPSGSTDPTIYNFEVSNAAAVPEPTTAVLALVGVAGALGWRRARREWVG